MFAIFFSFKWHVELGLPSHIRFSDKLNTIDIQSYGKLR